MKACNRYNQVALPFLSPVFLFILAINIDDRMDVIAQQGSMLMNPPSNSFPNIMRLMSDTMLCMTTNAINVFFVFIIVF